MDAIDVENWYEDVATRLKDIGHTPNDVRFARNEDELKEGLRTKIPCKEFTLVLDEPYGQLINQETDTLLDMHTSSFSIVKKVKVNDWQQESVVFDESKKILWKIIAKILKERRDYYEGTDMTGIMRHMDQGSIKYRKQIFKGHSLFGVYCTFDFVDSITDELQYNAGDWT